MHNEYLRKAVASDQYLKETVLTGTKIMIEAMKEAGITDEQFNMIDEISRRKWEEAGLIMKAGML